MRAAAVIDTVCDDVVIHVQLTVYIAHALGLVRELLSERLALGARRLVLLLRHDVAELQPRDLARAVMLPAL